MDITLISLDREVYCIGIRIISACLRKAGHNVQLVFLLTEEPENATDKFNVTYSEEVLSELRILCEDSDLVGLSLMSNQFIQAINVTEYLKSHDITVPIVWGGIQPTVEPEECLEYADIICIGEGEEAAAVELADNIHQDRPYFETKNMWFKTKDGIIQNPLRPVIQDLDSIPFPDYSCENHYISTEKHIKKLSVEMLKKFQGERFKGNGKSIVYMFMTSRGCPFNCTYCANSVYHSLYQKQKMLRWRSAKNIIEELKMIQNEVAPISYVYMVDDNFSARPSKKLKEFCDLYQREIGIPFFAQVSPLTISEEKMDILFNAGCAHITMGVETANARIAEMYNRSREHKVMRKAINLIEKYRPRMSPPPTYQFIIDNPYETVDEMLETLRLACSFPRPWHNPIYSLMLFPGVPLFYKAVKDGLITDKYTQIYGRNWRSQSRPFFQFWIRLYQANITPIFLRILLLPSIARMLNSDFANTIWRLRCFRWLWSRQ